MKKSTGFEIREEERQSWGSIAMVWIGSVICVPALMVGGMLGNGLSMGGTFVSIPVLSFLNIPFFIGPVNGIVTAILVYIVPAGIRSRKN